MEFKVQYAKLSYRFIFPAVYILLKSKLTSMEFSTDQIESLKVQLLNP